MHSELIGLLLALQLIKDTVQCHIMNSLIVLLVRPATVTQQCHQQQVPFMSKRLKVLLIGLLDRPINLE